MRLDYFDMLSGEPIFIHGVGHIRSPKLGELRPSSGVGYKAYNWYLSLMSWDKKQLLRYDALMKYRGVEKLEHERLNVFDAVILIQQTRELYRGVLSFFIAEDIVWDKSSCKYIVYVIDEETEEPRIVGEITRDNFEDVRNLILQMNFIGLDKDGAPVKHSSEKSKELWERVQGYLADQTKRDEAEPHPEYRLSNIISKLCAVHPSYNLLNIYDLTIFQLYDAFFQVGYMRSADLSEQVFCNHGGDKFKFEDWLKPILKNV